MQALSIPLVGTHFRPPAKDILTALPLGTELILQPEPENPYDRNAVMVLVDMAEFPADRVPLLNALLPAPYDASEICSNGAFHLGYLAASKAKTARGGPGNVEALMLLSVHLCKITLGSAPEGHATVEIRPYESL